MVGGSPRQKSSTFDSGISTRSEVIAKNPKSVRNEPVLPYTKCVQECMVSDYRWLTHRSYSGKLLREKTFTCFVVPSAKVLSYEVSMLYEMVWPRLETTHRCLFATTEGVLASWRFLEFSFKPHPTKARKPSCNKEYT